MKNDFKLKCDALNNDNNIMKCQIEKLINANHEPLNYQQEMSNCKQRVDILLKANENLVKEIKRLQLTRNNDRNLCVSCCKPLLEIQEKNIESIFDDDGQNNNVETTVNHHMEAVCRKYQKLEEALKREQRWSESINKTYLELVSTTEILTEENKLLRAEIETLKLKLSGDKPREDSNSVETGGAISKAREIKQTNTVELAQISKPKKTPKKCKQSINCNPESVAIIEKLLKEIPDTPTDTFECCATVNQASEDEQNHTEIFEDSANWDISSMGSICDNVKKTSGGDKNTESNLISLDHDVLKDSELLEEEDIVKNPKARLMRERQMSNLSDETVCSISVIESRGNFAENVAGQDHTMSKQKENKFPFKKDTTKLNKNQKEFDVVDIGKNSNFMNLEMMKDQDSVPLQASVDLVFDECDVDFDVLALDDVPIVADVQGIKPDIPRFFEQGSSGSCVQESRDYLNNNEAIYSTVSTVVPETPLNTTNEEVQETVVEDTGELAKKIAEGNSECVISDGHLSDDECVITFESSEIGALREVNNKAPSVVKIEEVTEIVTGIGIKKDTISYDDDFVVEIDEDVLNNFGDLREDSLKEKVQEIVQTPKKQKKRNHKKTLDNSDEKQRKQRRMECFPGNESIMDVDSVVSRESNIAKIGVEEIREKPMSNNKFDNILSGSLTGKITKVTKNIGKKSANFANLATEAEAQSAKNHSIMKKLAVKKGDGKVVQKLAASIAKIFQRTSVKEIEYLKFFSKLKRMEYVFERFCHCYVKAIVRQCRDTDNVWSDEEILEVTGYLVPRVMATTCKGNDRGLEILGYHVMECLANGGVGRRCAGTVLSVMVTMCRLMAARDSLVAVLVDVLSIAEVPVSLVVSVLDRLGFIDYEEQSLSDVTHNWLLGYLRLLYQATDASEHLSQAGLTFWGHRIQCCLDSAVAHYLRDRLVQIPDSLPLVEVLWAAYKRRSK